MTKLDKYIKDEVRKEMQPLYDAFKVPTNFEDKLIDYADTCYYMGMFPGDRCYFDKAQALHVELKQMYKALEDLRNKEVNSLMNDIYNLTNRVIYII
jgi:hypothetical protein